MSEDKQSEKNTTDILAERIKKTLKQSGCGCCGSSGCCDLRISSKKEEETDQKDWLQ